MSSLFRLPHPRPVSLDASPVQVAAGLRHRPGLVFLDSSTQDEAPGSGYGGGDDSRFSIISCDPTDVVEGGPQDWASLTSWCPPVGREGVLGPDWGFPTGGLIGWIDYEGSYRFGVYPQALIHDHTHDQWWDVGNLSARLDWRALEREPRLPREHEIRRPVSRDRFLSMVERALDYISAGDIYQVNLSQPFQSEWPGGDPFDLYCRLRAVSPAPFGAFLDLGDRQVLSASPELFLRLSGSHMRTRPIKGTRPRFADPDSDERSAYDLITSAKEIAELIMITDLERNDLGRVCEYGSVRAVDLLRLERFAQVFHLVSTIEGVARPGLGHAEALAACFPGGSITGAPKKRAREIIRELEQEPRGLYTGAIGCFGFNGESRFSIAIRTAVLERRLFSFRTGAGIVADSLPEKEYEETLHKAAGILAACGAGDRL